jgi:hypothetical protein
MVGRTKIASDTNAIAIGRAEPRTAVAGQAAAPSKEGGDE